MFTLNYDFQPGDTVFVVIDGTRVEEGTVLNVKFKIYLDPMDMLVEKIDYTILLADADEGTVTQDSTTVFATLAEAGDYISNFLTPTPTVTPTTTPTVTPTITPTVTPTISITPSVSPTATVTPTISVTPTITPTVTASVTVTPTVTPTQGATPTVTPTPEVTPSVTASVTPTVTASVTVTPTVTPTVTSTATPTVTPSVTASPTVTPTPSVSSISQSLLILEDEPAPIISQHTLTVPNTMSSAIAENITYDISTVVSDPSGMYTDESGTRLIVLDNNSCTVHRFQLSTPWSLNTASYTGDFYKFNDDSHLNMREVFFNPTGTRLFIINDNGQEEVHQHDLSVAWDLSSINPGFVSLDIRPQGEGTGLYFGDSGTKLYISGNTNHRVEQFNLSVPYDISTAVFNQFLSITIASETVESLALSATGDKLFVYVDGNIRTYLLGTNWNVSTGTLEGTNGTYNPTGIGRGRSINLELYS